MEAELAPDIGRLELSGGNSGGYGHGRDDCHEAAAHSELRSAPQLRWRRKKKSGIERFVTRRG
jgi:hypothetical protein